jgi:hypothetical protein
MHKARWALVAGVVSALAALIQIGTASLTIGLTEESSERIGAGKMLWLGVATLVVVIGTATAGSRFRILPILTDVLVVVSLAPILFGTIRGATEVYSVEVLVSFFVISVLLGRLCKRPAVMRPAGFEPATSRSGGERSIP